MAHEPSTKPMTYRDAGVDIAAATTALEKIKLHARSTFGVPGATTPIGHFGGVFHLPSGPDQMLVASADGVGTKLKLAFALGGEAHFRVGADLVNHCANDILACGARPLFFLDYVAMGVLDPIALERLIDGMATACRENRMALIGGETAEMPGMYADGEYDAAGFIVGTVAPDRLIDGSDVTVGDVLVGLPSAGMHTNGYSLARRIVGLTGDVAHDRNLLGALLPGSSQTVGEALLQPHLAYLPQVLPNVEARRIRGIAHITGGGLIDNVPRMLPETVAAQLDTATWESGPLFDWLCAKGNVSAEERYRAFNMGIGMVLAVAAGDAEVVIGAMPGARIIGQVVDRSGESQVLGLAG